ncbi:hypothetical protein [Mycolicibacterium sp. CBMA 226]|uniref:hypothetical protein n=1 Tax=Mycolicibacterium sp. CBMA 226 TaxID=2606611 RepID=UPI0012DEE0F5|nr:hypothetical protein [Mycolicibacterium sp. CBMA 226]MUL78251.1 hypothetical protein [Mycolicibacterium sp. CBMA 226]
MITGEGPVLVRDGGIAARLRSVMARYLEAMNQGNRRRLSLATLGAAYFDNDFDERSVSPFHQVAPFIWTRRGWQVQAGDTVLAELRVLAYSDDIAAAHVTVEFERPPTHLLLPDGNVLVIFQRVNTRWKISAITRYTTEPEHP